MQFNFKKIRVKKSPSQKMTSKIDDIFFYELNFKS